MTDPAAPAPSDAQARLHRIALTAQEIARIAEQAQRVAAHALQDGPRAPNPSGALAIVSAVLQDLAEKVQRASETILEQAEADAD